MEYRPPNGFMSFLQGESHSNFTLPTPQQLGFQYLMFCMQPPPPAKHHPLPSTSDPRTSTPSNERKRVTTDVEGDDEDRQRLYYTKDEDIRLVSVLFRNCVNPIDGNAKKGEYY
ncbi:hypothetical protein D1007_57729 [Hordeum vulgare]|nr:hypothetical protein D1007_57729 [Hordeum vulgare]